MQTVGDNTAGHIGDTHRLGSRSFAALSLFAANLGMLIIYVVFDLTLFQLVLVYWWEALWIGLFSGVKLLTASLFGNPFENRWIDVSRGSGIFLSLFAIIKSGGAFLILLVLSGVALVVAQQELTGTPGNDFVSKQAGLMLNCSLLFLVAHGISFVINFLILGEFRHARFGTLLWLPFKRALALFVTIVAALTTIQAYPGILSDTYFAAILIAVKLGWDYLLHRRERRSFSTSGIETERDA
jgi:hypothetical protein